MTVKLSQSGHNAVATPTPAKNTYPVRGKLIMEKITEALKALVSSLEPLCAQQRVLAEVAFALAEKLDSGDGGSMSAALGREIRATLAAMVPAEDESLGRELNAFLQGLAR